MTTWTDVTPGTAQYKTAHRGQLYAGFKGGLLAGMLTLHTGVAFYAGYIGIALVTTWTDVSVTSTTWSDV